MYGLVNRALQDMVCDRFGPEIWQVICQKATVETDQFLRLSFPRLCPPSVECSDSESEFLTLHYHSEQKGLASMVIGLLKGAGTSP
ncbi:MAG: heme NO-binding domain-containing protein [Leptolyngbyaceae cyanobacterium bins.59]|nr:heme NO-binding domain-containing protein [Leptolyngbyaceae cyanobacterium bins.59]